MRGGGFWRAVMLCLVVAPCLVAKQTDAAPKFEDLRARGRKAYRAHRYEEARDLWADAYVLRDDAETAADLALAYQHTNENDRAIKTNRDAIRLSSSGKLDSNKARRIRRGAYYNLGKLEAVRKLQFGQNNDGPSSCIEIDSEPGCDRSLFACGYEGQTTGMGGGYTSFVARFALTRADARIVEDGVLMSGFESRVDFGYNESDTRDRSDAPSYGVTLSWELTEREPSPDEAEVTVATEHTDCDVVYVDACARRLGLYCGWGTWRADAAPDQGSAKAVELTFARKSAKADP